MSFKNEIKQIIKFISPILIKPQKAAIHIKISKDFLLLKLLRNIARKIESDPYLNFISELKYYKVFGKLIHGPITTIYLDRNKIYFKHFFANKELYEIVKKDIEWVYEINKKIIVTINKNGYIIYDNYHQNKFNLLLLTIHSGTWMPESLSDIQVFSKKDRLLEEDIDIHKIYGPLVLQNAGIWIDDKLSRFACDYNRSPEKAIYENDSEAWIKTVWKKPLSHKLKSKFMRGYNDFYLTLTSIVNSYHFNIILDGHSMKDATNRAEISFGTKYIPKFYMPVVRSMKKQLMQLGHNDVDFDKPFSGGYILEWLSKKFPNIFICSIEVNKKLYMNKTRTKSILQNLQKLSEDLIDTIKIN